MRQISSIPGIPTIAVVSAALFLVVSCTFSDPVNTTVVDPTPTAITLPPTPTAITFPPTPTAITFPPSPTAFALPPDASLLPSTADVVQDVSPSVVHIQVQTRFGDSSGTGVVLEENGIILTNQHIVDGAISISVALTDDSVFEGTIIGEDESVDIAIVKIEAEGLQPARLGDSSILRVGEDVIAIGHALGLAGGPTVSKGIVSALGRTVNQGADQLTDLIQTDAAINPGNSGGPLLNANGHVIGINTARLDSGEGIGFAIEINLAQSIVEQLIHQSTLPPGVLGIRGIDITPALAQIIGLPVTRGVGIVNLEDGGAAQLAGLEIDDIIVRINEEAILDNSNLSKLMRTHRPGEVVTITIVRGQQLFQTQATLGGPEQ
jgi:serine protease Do